MIAAGLGAVALAVAGSGAATVTTAPGSASRSAISSIAGAASATTRRPSPTSTTRAPKPSKTVTILVVAPTSGAEAETGAATVRAVALAIRHATEDKLLPTGWGVEIETIDEAARSGPSAAVGRKLKKEADIVAVIGALDPDTIAPLDLATAEQNTTLLVVSPSATRHDPPASVASGSVPLTLRMLTDDATTGAYAADYATTVQRAADVVGTPPTDTANLPTSTLAPQPAATSTAPTTVVPRSTPTATGASTATTTPVPSASVATANTDTVNARAFVAAFASRLAATGTVVDELGLVATDRDGLTPAFLAKAVTGSHRLVAFGGPVDTGLPLAAAARGAQPVVGFLIGGQVDVSGVRRCVVRLGRGRPLRSGRHAAVGERPGARLPRGLLGRRLRRAHRVGDRHLRRGDARAPGTAGDDPHARRRPGSRQGPDPADGGPAQRPTRRCDRLVRVRPGRQPDDADDQRAAQAGRALDRGRRNGLSACRLSGPAR